MSDTNTDESNDTDEPIDITEKAHERGSEGQLLPVEKPAETHNSYPGSERPRGDY